MARAGHRGAGGDGLAVQPRVALAVGLYNVF